MIISLRTLLALASCMLISAGGMPCRDGVDFIVIEARYADLPESSLRKLEELEKDRVAGKITPEQAQKRDQALRKNQPLYLLGYFGTEARAIYVKRTDADTAKWTPGSFPSSIRFEKAAPARREDKVWMTPVGQMPRQGWTVSANSCEPAVRYRLHPWLDPKRFRAVSPTLEGDVTGVTFLPRYTNTVSTSVGTFTSGGAPDRWAIAATVTNPETDQIRGYFKVRSSDGAELGSIELDAPLAPGRPTQVQVVVFSKPVSPKRLSLQCVAAIAERVDSPSEPKP